jgi:hypothetical protein
VTTRAKKPIGVWGSYQGGAFEKIEETVTRREAAKLAKEYRSAFGAGWVIVVGVAKPRKNPARRVDARAAVKWTDKETGFAYAYEKSDLFRVTSATLEAVIANLYNAYKARKPLDPEQVARAWELVDHIEMGIPSFRKVLGMALGKDSPHAARKNPSEAPIVPLVGGAIAAPRRRRRRRVRANCLGPIAAMQAGRRPRKNPEIVPHSITDSPLPGVKPPRQLALLAELVELVVTTRSGEQRTIRPKPNTAAMLTDRTGEVLWFVWPTKAKRVAMPPGARREKKIFETWSKHKASVALKFSTGEAVFPGEPIGAVRVVRYRSDKWTGEPTLYEHEFTSRNVQAFADSVRNPKLIYAGIPTHDPRQAVVLVTSRGLVG